MNIKNPKLKEDIKQKGFKLYFWDIGGQTDKLWANEYYFVQAVGAMVIFSLDKISSFDHIDFWISKLEELSGDVPYIIVGNKTDLKREINKEIIHNKVKKLKVEYFETSAKMDENVDNVFENLSIQILNKIK